MKAAVVRRVLLGAALVAAVGAVVGARSRGAREPAPLPRTAGGSGPPAESEVGSGTLFSSGLIAGGSLAGILYAVLYGADWLPWFTAIGDALPFMRGEDAVGQIASALLFFVLAVVLARFAQRSLD